jgi:DNA-directed RNA polymerase specialized sigma24 family protein
MIGAWVGALVTVERAAREQAAAALTPILHELARSRVPANRRDDIVADVMIKLLKAIRAPVWPDSFPALTDSDDRWRAFLHTVIHNRWIDVLRADQRANRPQPPPIDDAEEPIDLMPEARAIVDRAMVRARELRKRNRAALQAAYLQMIDLVFDGNRMMARGSERNRLYKAQERLRDALLVAIDDLTRTNDLSEREASFARAVVTRFLVRCQRSDRPDVDQDVTS